MVPAFKMCRGFAALVLGVALPSLSPKSWAQETWVARSSGVSAHLWGVGYGNGRWVAVGEQGVIVTSADGVAWIKCDSGFPDRWLTGVTYAAGIWVAVGGTAPNTESKALVLTSSDAVIWTPRVSAGTRINNVAYGNGTFAAMDDNGNPWVSRDGTSWSRGFPHGTGYVRGLVFGAPFFIGTGLTGIYSSYEGSSWTNDVPTAGQIEGAAYGRRQFVLAGADGTTFISRDSRSWTQQPTTTTTTFRGATFFNNQFIAVGNSGSAGRGIATSFDGARWTERLSPIAAGVNLLGVAAGPDSAIAVGEGGIILHSSAAANPPAIVTQPVPVREAIGGNVAFTVVASGALPLRYQWRKDTLDVPGATGDTLFLPAVQSTRAGNYSCVVTNSFDSANTDVASLTVLDRNPIADPVDPTFALDTTFSTAPRVAALQADGKILLGGSFVVANQGRAQFGLARLNANGSFDTSFAPVVIDFGGGLPNSVRTVTTIAVQPDGKILVSGTSVGIGGASGRSFARLNPDGSDDSTFVPAKSPGGLSPQLLLDSSGRILVVDGSTSVSRLNPNGSADATWSFRSIQTAAGAGTSINVVTCTVKRIAQLPGGDFVVVATTPFIPPSVISDPFSPPLPPTQFSFLERLDSNGNDRGRFDTSASNSVLDLVVTPDGNVHAVHSFGISRVPYTSSGPLPISVKSATCVAPAADGGFWLSGAFSTVRNGYSNHAAADVPRNQIVRVNSDLSVDSFDPGLGPVDASGVAVAPLCLLALPDGRAIICGNFTRIDTVPRSQVARLNARSLTGINPPTVIAFEQAYREIRDGEPFTITAFVTGSPPYSFADPATVDPTTGIATVKLTLDTSFGKAVGGTFATGTVTVTMSTTGLGTVRAANSVGASAPQYFFVRSLPSPPVIAVQPSALQTNTGRALTLGVTPFGTQPISYQWSKDGIALKGATASTYVVSKATIANAGNYSVSIRNSLGSVTSNSIHVGVDETARIINLSTRGSVGPGGDPLIVGFVIQGPGSKRVMLRAVGPTLGSPPFNVAGFLADPVLRVYDSSGTQVYLNDDWGQSSDAALISTANIRLGAFPLGNGSADSGGILTLAPGAYTAQISGKAPNSFDATGVALAEVYDDDAQSSRLVNISARGFVGPGASIMIPGFVTTTACTPAPKKFLVRGVGPSLQQFGVANTLANPTLTIVDSAGKTVASNDDWEQNQNIADLRAATTSLAFPLAPGSKDAALLIALPPGQYTALVSGVGNTSGVALVEVYEVP